MSLPSQGGFGFGGATRKRRRGRRPMRRVVGVLLLVGVAGGMVWAFLPPNSSSAGEPQRDASETRLAATDRAEPLSPIELAARPPQAEASPQVPAGSAARSDTQGRTPAAEPRRPSPDGAREVRQAAPPPAAIELDDRRDTPASTPRASAVASLIARAEQELKANDPLQARELYNRALMSEQATEAERATIRQRMGAINQDLLFSPRVYEGDPFTATYIVQNGDYLSTITQREGLAVDWRLLVRINRLASDGIRGGQRLKLVRGPFNAVVDKSEFRLDLYAGPPDEPTDWMFIRSYDVGLGEYDGTPVGAFEVKRHSKLIDPHWVNPRTGERFSNSDPENPIGERWIGLRGLGEASVFTGYGIHGTIEPESIGHEKSMGCVRMLPDDVATIYEMLAEEISQVHIVP
ncbi:MAG: L,D-transpeptidase family protein [Planctomycetota bacterium]